MTEIKMQWTKKNVWDYVVFNSLFKSMKQKAVFIAYFVCIVLVIIIGGVSYSIIQSSFVIVIVAAALVMLGLYWLLFMLLLKSYAKEILENNKEEYNTICRFDEKVITVFKDDKPIGEIPWDVMIEICISKTAAYLTSKDESLLIAEFEGIITGDKQQFLSLLSSKKTISVKGEEKSAKK